MFRWYTNFKKRQRRHAIACIRFFVRDVFLKIRNRKKVAQIARITNTKALQETQKRLNQHLTRAKFTHWRNIYVLRQSKIAFNTLATRMPILYARKKDRRKIAQLRVKREYIITRGMAKRFREYNFSFYKWRLLTSTLRIQRFVRIFLAKCALFRRVNLRRRIIAHGVAQVYKCKVNHLKSWLHFLKRRTFRRKSARNCIVRMFHKYGFFRRLGKKCIKNSRMINFLLLIDMKHKRKSFGQLHRMVFGVKQFQCMKKMCQILNRLILTDAFQIFLSNTRDQHRMSGLVRLHIRKPLNRMMDNAADDESWTYRSNSGYVSGDIVMINSTVEDQSTPIDIRRWPSLLNTAPSNVHMTTQLYDKKKIFQEWLFAYRLQQMRRIETCVQNCPQVIDAALVAFSVKRKNCVIIQKWIRRWYAVIICRQKRLKMLLYWEKITLVRARNKQRFRQRNFQEMMFLALHAKSARLTLQCWARQCLARMARVRRKIELGEEQKKEFAVFRLYRRNALSKIMRLMEFGCVLRCCAIQLSSPRERHHQSGGTKRPLQSLDNKQSRIRLNKKKTLTLKDFSSDAYHSYLFRLKQTGVLVIDSSNLGALKPNELAFLISSAATLFSQASGEHHALSDIANNFQGNKIIICGGTISAGSAYDLYYLLTSRDEKININFSEVTVCFNAVTKIARSLEHNFAKIRELSIDSDSIGSLGIAALLVSLKVTNYSDHTCYIHIHIDVYIIEFLSFS